MVDAKFILYSLLAMLSAVTHFFFITHIPGSDLEVHVQLEGTNMSERMGESQGSGEGIAAVQDLSFTFATIMTANVCWVLFTFTNLRVFLVVVVAESLPFLISEAYTLPFLPSHLPMIVNTPLLFEFQLWAALLVWIAFVMNALYTLPRVNMLLNTLRESEPVDLADKKTK